MTIPPLSTSKGFHDVSYNGSPIPTPFIDQVSAAGIRLQNYYTHSLCTPSRAALLSGKFHVNAGLNTVLFHGTPAGLPSDIITLPAVLASEANYSTAMVGKWHLGHSQPHMTPTGKRFDYFKGLYMW